MSCAYHSLNLTLCDMAHFFFVKIVSFFGIVQYIYLLFTNLLKDGRFYLIMFRT